MIDNIWAVIEYRERRSHCSKLYQLELPLRWTWCTNKTGKEHEASVKPCSGLRGLPSHAKLPQRILQHSQVPDLEVCFQRVAEALFTASRVAPKVFVNSSSVCETCKPSRKVRLKLAIIPSFSESLFWEGQLEDHLVLRAERLEACLKFREQQVLNL